MDKAGRASCNLGHGSQANSEAQLGASQARNGNGHQHNTRASQGKVVGECRHWLATCTRSGQRGGRVVEKNGRRHEGGEVVMVAEKGWCGWPSA